MHREKFNPLLLSDLVARLGEVETTVNEMRDIVRLVVSDLNDRIFELECSQDDLSTYGSARCNFLMEEDD